MKIVFPVTSHLPVPSEFCQAPFSGCDRAILLVGTTRIIVDAGRIQSW
jgi:hypothetical protein